MATYTVIRRGKAKRDSSGKVIGYEKGKPKEVTTSSSRRSVVDVRTGKAYSKTKRTTDKSGKVTIGANKNVYQEINTARTQQGLREQEGGMTLAPNMTVKPSEPNMSYASRNDLRQQSFNDQKSFFRGSGASGSWDKEQKKTAPNISDKDFFWKDGKVGKFNWEGQKQALERSGDALKQTGSGIINTITFGKFGAKSEFTAGSMVGDKTAYFLEKGANNPLSTAGIVASPFGVVKAGGISAGVTGTLARGTSTITTGAAAGNVITGIREAKTISSEEFSFLRRSEVKEAQKVAFEKQRASTGFWGGAGQEVSLFIGGGGSRGYKNFLTNELIDRGYTGKDLSTATGAGMKSRSAKGWGEAGGLIVLSTGAEITGKFTQKAFGGFVEKKGVKVAGSFRKGATQTGFSVAPAGAAEGFGQQIIQQDARGQDRDFKQAAIYGGVGAITASTIGGLIGGASTSSRKGLKKTTEVAAYVADPYEGFGDVAATGIAKAKGVKIPVMSLGGSKKSGVSFGSTPSRNNPFGSTPSESNPFASTPITSQSTVPNITPSESFNQNIVPSTSNTQTSTTTKSTVPTFTNVPTFTSSPTFTTNIKLPPFFIPFSFGGAGGVGNYVGKKGGKGGRSGLPPTLIGQFTGKGTKTRKGKTYSGIGVRV